MAATRLIVPANSSNVAELIAPAAAALRHGELVVFPTETVYGIGAAADNHDALTRIYTVKQRPTDKPLGYHIGSWEMFRRIAGTQPEQIESVLQRHWPGPVTFLLEIAGAKVGFRFPSDTVAQVFLEACATPVLATSANLSGEASPTHAGMTLSLEYAAAYLIDTGVTAWQGDSTIVDMTDDPPRCVRRGVVPWN